MNITTYFIYQYLECVIGKYGDQCQDTCGACLDPNQCSNTDGACLTGCAPGFTGPLCKTSKNLIQTATNIYSERSERCEALLASEL